MLVLIYCYLKDEEVDCKVRIVQVNRDVEECVCKKVVEFVCRFVLVVGWLVLVDDLDFEYCMIGCVFFKLVCVFYDGKKIYIDFFDNYLGEKFVFFVGGLKNFKEVVNLCW